MYGYTGWDICWSVCVSQWCTIPARSWFRFQPYSESLIPIPIPGVFQMFDSDSGIGIVHHWCQSTFRPRYCTVWGVGGVSTLGHFHCLQSWDGVLLGRTLCQSCLHFSEVIFNTACKWTCFISIAPAFTKSRQFQMESGNKVKVLSNIGQSFNGHNFATICRIDLIQLLAGSSWCRCCLSVIYWWQ